MQDAPHPQSHKAKFRGAVGVYLQGGIRVLILLLLLALRVVVCEGLAGNVSRSHEGAAGDHFGFDGVSLE